MFEDRASRAYVFALLRNYLKTGCHRERSVAIYFVSRYARVVKKTPYR